MRKKIVIIGGGFGGLAAAKNLRNANADIILIDKTNHHLFQPLLYQVATAALSPADIAAPIRGILSSQKNVSVILGEVTGIDLEAKKVSTKDEVFEYDYLIVSPGSSHSYYGREDWAKYAPGLKTLAQALNIRERILLSFENAENAKTESEKEKDMTFVVVGGGPTGVEMAGAIAEIAKRILLKDFRKIDPAKTKILLVEVANRILTSFDSTLSDVAMKDLKKLGVTILLNTRVINIDENCVYLSNGIIQTQNIIWAAGNTIPAFVKTMNTETDKTGRVTVNKDLSIKDHPEVFVIGDAAGLMENGKQLPGVAPVAIQGGKFVGKTIKNEINGKGRSVFRYFDKGNLATIGRAKAVMQIGDIKLSGFFAWIAWVFVHIMYLIGFRNRYKVMAEWFWYYITFRHGIRLITNYDPKN